MKTLFVWAAVVGTLAGCGASEKSGKGATWQYHSPVGVDAASLVASLDRDCLQYPVEKRADGTEVWNADFVYYKVVHESQAVVVDDADLVDLLSKDKLARQG